MFFLTIRPTHVTLSSFLSFGVVIQTLKDWLQLRKKVAGAGTKIGKLEMVRHLWPLFGEDWRSSIYGQEAISNLLMFNLFESAFNQLPTQKKGVYLHEQQPWEFGLIQAWKSGGHEALIGFPHATVCFWDLRYFFDHRSYVRGTKCQLPLPDRLACNGKVALEAFKLGGYPRDDLTRVESLRYLYLANAVTNRAATEEI